MDIEDPRIEARTVETAVGCAGGGAANSLEVIPIENKDSELNVHTRSSVWCFTLWIALLGVVATVATIVVAASSDTSEGFFAVNHNETAVTTLGTNIPHHWNYIPIGVDQQSLRSSVQTLSMHTTPLNMREAGRFALLAKGGITHGAVSVVAGDIGVYGVTATIVANPDTPEFNGTSEINTDSTERAGADLDAAFADGISRDVETGSLTIPTAGYSGNDWTSYPGVYMGAGVNIAAGVTWNLLLPESGSQDTVFIFQFTGALIVGADVNIQIGGVVGQICDSNVYFVVQGAVSIGRGTKISGTIIAAGAITLGADASTGPLLSKDTITLGTGTSIGSYCWSGDADYRSVHCRSLQGCDVAITPSPTTLHTLLSVESSSPSASPTAGPSVGPSVSPTATPPLGPLDMQEAGRFALLASVSITHGTVTDVKGDIGVYGVGAEIVANSGAPDFTGTVEMTTDATMRASLDLKAAFAEGFALPTTTGNNNNVLYTLQHTTRLNAKWETPPGVYENEVLNIASSLSWTMISPYIYQVDVASVWIFKFNGNLTIGTDVIISQGTYEKCAENIYILVKGTVRIGAGSHILGTIISEGPIILGENVQTGPLLTTSSIYLDDGTSIESYCRSGHESHRSSNCQSVGCEERPVSTTVTPSIGPSASPTATPSISPTMPTATPSVGPSASPTMPTTAPSKGPSASPTASPSVGPSVSPTATPSASPTMPTAAPSIGPSTSPTAAPSISPTMPTSTPSVGPSASPTMPTAAPSIGPSPSPTASPSVGPSTSPTATPSVSPTMPTATPSIGPSVSPTAAPSIGPSRSPTASPSAGPSISPTATPSVSPTMPTATPSIGPSVSPTATPSISPTTTTKTPSIGPSAAPTMPTTTPSIGPSASPTPTPSVSPTMPTATPSIEPSVSPTSTPSIGPTASPTVLPPLVPLEMQEAGRFGLFARDRITHNDVLYLYGDVGLKSPEAAIDTLPGASKFTGRVEINSVGTTLASSSLDAAWNEAYGHAQSTTDHGIPEFITGDWGMFPGVYDIGNLTLVGDLNLYFDTRNHAVESVWIFRLSGSLTIQNDVQMIMNHGCASNIFFLVEGSVTIGTGSHVRGTIMSKANITLGDQSTSGPLLSGDSITIGDDTSIGSYCRLGPQEYRSTDCGYVDGCGVVPPPLVPLDMQEAGRFGLFAQDHITHGNVLYLYGDVGLESPEAAIDTLPGASEFTGRVEINSAGTTLASSSLTTAWDVDRSRMGIHSIPEFITGDWGMFPGVYNMGNLTLARDLNLYFDTRNHAVKSVWIFRLSGSLIIQNGVRVIMNQGCASNIFFLVEGSVTIGTGSHMRGTIMSKSDITLGDQSTSGPLLSNASIIVGNDTSIFSYCRSGPAEYRSYNCGYVDGCGVEPTPPLITATPSIGPSASPTRTPSVGPTASPTKSTAEPSVGPSVPHTATPSIGPSASPTSTPTLANLCTKQSTCVAPTYCSMQTCGGFSTCRMYPLGVKYCELAFDQDAETQSSDTSKLIWTITPQCDTEMMDFNSVASMDFSIGANASDISQPWEPDSYNHVSIIRILFSYETVMGTTLLHVEWNPLHSFPEHSNRVCTKHTLKRVYKGTFQAPRVDVWYTNCGDSSNVPTSISMDIHNCMDSDVFDGTKVSVSVSAVTTIPIAFSMEAKTVCPV
jgi:predicted acyltransferase (DUF342 family)